MSLFNNYVLLRNFAILILPYSYLNAEPESRDFDILPIISALNLVLQQHASRNGIRVGNSRYFYSTEGIDSLGSRIDGWKGFFLSVRPTLKQLMLNV